jgi:hypothetical protein
MLYTWLAPVMGSVLLVTLIVINLMGLKAIKASVKAHKGLGTVITSIAAVHLAYGWVLYFPNLPIGIILGTVIVALMFINILSGARKIKLSVAVHRIIGLVALAIGLFHGITGLVNNINF